jgi:hypothetical protein
MIKFPIFCEFGGLVMSDNRRVYRQVHSRLRKLYPKKLAGNQARHINTLAMMTAGIVQSKQSHLEKIARHAPDGNHVSSREKKFTRFIKNDEINAQTYFLPFIMALLTSLASSGSLILVMDASETGRRCLTLMVSVVYCGRALPIVWKTVKGNKGHLPETTHLELLWEAQAVMPNGAAVIFLGDGEFDGSQLQQALTNAGWEYVCRTAKNRQITDEGDQFALDEILLCEGDCVDMPGVSFGHEGYGPVLVIAWWKEGCEAPIYLVSNMECVDEACYLYGYRFTIETFFSDQKSRGFNLNKSHISDPERIARFLIASCLAYIWVIYLGVRAVKDKLQAIIHRADRCDLSLFQLGLRMLEHLLNEDLDIPFELIMPNQCRI